MGYRKVQAEQGYITVSPMPTTEELEKFYADLYYQQSVSTTYAQEYPDDELKYRRLRARLLFHAIRQQRGGISKGNMLEIGCGEGFVLAAGAEEGYQVTGVDFSAHGIERFNPEMRKNFLPGNAYDLLQKLAVDGKKFDICILKNVLEHVLDPKELLSRLQTVLKGGSILAVEVPNDSSVLQERLLQDGRVDREYWFAPPQHLHYFNVGTLRTFMTGNDLKVLDVYGDFPIEHFLLHPGANYIQSPSAGGAAHQARLTLELLAAESGIDAYHRYCQALSGCGFGRNVTVLTQIAA